MGQRLISQLVHADGDRYICERVGDDNHDGNDCGDYGDGDIVVDMGKVQMLINLGR